MANATVTMPLSMTQLAIAELAALLLDDLPLGEIAERGAPNLAGLMQQRGALRQEHEHRRRMEREGAV